MASTVALLMAAGFSHRMGSPKALLPWQSTTLIEYQIAMLEEVGVDLIIVVLGHQAKQVQASVEAKDNISWVVNQNYSQGKTTSIKAGVHSLKPHRFSNLLLLNVDQPRSTETLRYLLDKHHAGNLAITLPSYQGSGGHPIIIDSKLHDELCMIDEETLGLKALVRRHKNDVQRVEMNTPEVLLDLNTPQQYHAALQNQ
jgi:molybdenum cofactor cytidylyltransferase